MTRILNALAPNAAHAPRVNNTELDPPPRRLIDVRKRV